MIRIVFLLIVVAAIFFVGYYIGKTRQKKKTTLDSKTLDQILTELPTPLTQRQKDLEQLLFKFRDDMNS